MQWEKLFVLGKISFTAVSLPNQEIEENDDDKGNKKKL